MGPERAEEEKVEQKGVQSRKRRMTGQEEQREIDQVNMEQGGLESRKRKRTQEEENDEQDRSEMLEKQRQKNRERQRLFRERRKQWQEILEGESQEGTAHEQASTASPLIGQLNQ